MRRQLGLLTGINGTDSCTTLSLPAQPFFQLVDVMGGVELGVRTLEMNSVTLDKSPGFSESQHAHL